MNIRDIAKKAGVSVATVSRVLNHPENVSPKTKDHVLRVMKENNYTPNWFARALNLNKTNVIALLIPNILNPTFTRIAKGVEEVAHQKGCNILLCNTEGSLEKEQAYVEMLINKKVDGLIFTYSLLSADSFIDLEKQKIPYVLIGQTQDASPGHQVITDFCHGAYEATKHLIDNGRSKIAHISGIPNHAASIEKKAGYLKALTEAEITSSKELIASGKNTIEGGYIAAKKLLQLNPKPDAIFAANDLMAFGAMDALKTEGLRIPEDIAIVGYDNSNMAALVEPKLTTVIQPVNKMGLMAARLLFDTIDENNDTEPEYQRIYFESKLKIRKSCGHHERLREIFD